MTVVGTDKETGKVIFEKPKVGKKEKVEIDRVSIPQDRMNALKKLAAKDGFKPDAQSDKGVMAQTTRAVTAYIVLAIDLLIDKRAAPPKES